jgi:hypothetical protein
MSTNKPAAHTFAAGLILILVLFGFISGCDGYRFVAWTFDQISSTKTDAISLTVDPAQLYLQMSVFLDEYGKSHSLDCSLRAVEVPDYRFCGGRSITLELKKHDNGKVVLRIAQLGPITATKDYKEIRNELLNLVAKRFPQVHVSEILGVQ